MADISKLIGFFKTADINNDNKISGQEFNDAKASSKLNSVWGQCLQEGMTKDDFIMGCQLEHSQEIPKQEQSKAETPFKKDDLRAPATIGERKTTIAKSIQDIPQFGPNKDARFYDISSVNLSSEELLDLTIDDTTVMSDSQKKIVSDATENMKNPGLGISQLHEQGITGKGVTIAIIDQPLEDHKEYSNNIINYKEIGFDKTEDDKSSMHGPSVTSLAVGKNIGVAPDAKVSYYAAKNAISTPTKDDVNERIKYLQSLSSSAKDDKTKTWANEKITYLQGEMTKYDNHIAELQQKIRNSDSDTEKTQLQDDLTKYTEKNKSGVPYLTTNKSHITALNDILEQNKQLPKDKQISVVSISWGFDQASPDYPELQRTLDKAKKEGVFVVYTDIDRTYGDMRFAGANRNPSLDVDNPGSYEAASWWKDTGEKTPKEEKDKLLLVPMNHRTVADYKSTTGYRYEGNNGGMSWAAPYLAGNYSLAKQVNSQITPEQFFKLALDTSDECHNSSSGVYVGRIINPQKLIKAVKTEKLE